jgi:hypothetical protein
VFQCGLIRDASITSHIGLPLFHHSLSPLLLPWPSSEDRDQIATNDLFLALRIPLPAFFN